MSDDKTSVSEESQIIDLADLTFDFEDYFIRYNENLLSVEEKQEFSARVYGVFCRDFFNSGGDPAAIPKWAVNYVAENLYKALAGAPWQDVMGMPWDEPSPILTPKGKRALEIYAAVENALKDTPESSVTDLLSSQAQEHCVSYETARADYYAIKKSLKWKMGIPAKFLIQRDEN